VPLAFRRRQLPAPALSTNLPLCMPPPEMSSGRRCRPLFALACRPTDCFSLLVSSTFFFFDVYVLPPLPMMTLGPPPA